MPFQIPLSKNSTPAVPDSGWFASDFLLGAGMVIIQPETRKIVVIFNRKTQRWFLPKGRKDEGESIEQAALREAHEESGYRVEFLPLYTPSRAPAPSRTRDWVRNTEPIYVTTTYWAPRKRRGADEDHGGEYLSFYYVGYLAEETQHETGTGMPDEQEYESHLLSPDDAQTRLQGTPEERVVRIAWDLFEDGLKIDEYLREEAMKALSVADEPLSPPA
ncbi:hypothetical protein FIBSPDRAFT_847859 [Athelia psychrophila]|uniref:Nudix hydrolase domain-containing protein n=1 Tax=Athelia psychrophila TaxID=1759441 RepID=A0A166W092_9AGAM|nr:hypothetical protein FIBSPDRAFT_847859 [Fibularhizoctonia sp. CBS 109695]